MLDSSRFEGVTGFRLHLVTAVTPSVTPECASSTGPNSPAGINQAFLGKVDENGGNGSMHSPSSYVVEESSSAEDNSSLITGQVEAGFMGSLFG